MIYNQLCANILFNSLDNIITPHRFGLGEQEKTAQMWDLENENFGEGIYKWGGRAIEHTESAYTSNDIREHDQIQVVSLDSLNIPHCDLIKIDIQGYEYYAIQGAIQTLTKNKPVILLENNPGRSELDKKVLAIFSSLGYQGYRYHYDSGEDCILIHPESNKFQISLDTIKTLQLQIPIIYENLSSYSL
jgi:FkbM family methyltransferase